MNKTGVFSKIYISLMYLFLYLPIFVMIAFSFNSSKSRNVWQGFSLDWYKQLFENELIRSSFANTLIIAFSSAVIATIIGTLGAIGISALNKKQKALAINLTYLPIISPEIVTGVSLMLFYKLANLNLGLFTLLLSHITFNVPYVVLNVLPKIRQMDKFLYEAAQDLGCNPIQAFFKVIIWEIMPGIISGFLMAVTYSIDDFVISFFTTGPQSQTLPIAIYSMTRKRVSPEINALSTLLFLIVLTILIIINVLDSRKYKVNNSNI